VVLRSAPGRATARWDESSPEVGFFSTDDEGEVEFNSVRRFAVFNGLGKICRVGGL
jgi:hypothetical protein